jgi:hypothetical protein
MSKFLRELSSINAAAHAEDDAKILSVRWLTLPGRQHSA